MADNKRIVTGGPMPAAGGSVAILGPDSEGSTIRQVGMAVTIVEVVGVTGDMAVTEAADTFAATGKRTHLATMAVTEAADTFAATGKKTHIATMAVTEAIDTFAASGTTGFTSIDGDMAVTEGADTLAATGKRTHLGDLDATEAADTFAASGTPIIIGDLDATEAPDIFSSSVGPFGDLAVTEAPDRMRFSAYEPRRRRIVIVT